jgi:hypothetical protein
MGVGGRAAGSGFGLPGSGFKPPISRHHRGEREGAVRSRIGV